MLFCKELPTAPSLQDKKTLVAACCVSFIIHLLPLLLFIIPKTEHPYIPISLQTASIAVEIAAIPVTDTASMPPSPIAAPIPATDTTPAAPLKQENITRTSDSQASSPSKKLHKKQKTAKSAQSKKHYDTSRYESIITNWFKKHKRYGDLGEHETRLRFRIARNGFVVFYQLDNSTGDNDLDQAIINTLKSASPFPPVPADYSSDDEVQFLLPINNSPDIL